MVERTMMDRWLVLMPDSSPNKDRPSLQNRRIPTSKNIFVSTNANPVGGVPLRQAAAAPPLPLTRDQNDGLPPRAKEGPILPMTSL